MADRRIRNDFKEVRTRGGYHVGYVWQQADGLWWGRGRRTTEESHAVDLKTGYQDERDASMALLDALWDAKLFELAP